jgi:hypothetical protein
VIDKKSIGRTKLQMFSFFITAVLFFVTGFIFKNGNTWLIFILFYAASFFGQFGTNVTTYVMAAESYPAEVRSTLHGISAFSGEFYLDIIKYSFKFMLNYNLVSLDPHFFSFCL